MPELVIDPLEQVHVNDQQRASVSASSHALNDACQCLLEHSTVAQISQSIVRSDMMQPTGDPDAVGDIDRGPDNGCHLLAKDAGAGQADLDSRPVSPPDGDLLALDRYAGKNLITNRLCELAVKVREYRARLPDHLVCGPPEDPLRGPIPHKRLTIIKPLKNRDRGRVNQRPRTTKQPEIRRPSPL
jgi:hypothetical protein